MIALAKTEPKINELIQSTLANYNKLLFILRKIELKLIDVVKIMCAFFCNEQIKGGMKILLISSRGSIKKRVGILGL